MQTLYLLSVWLHVLAAAVWVGGLFFIVLVVVPWIRGGGRAHAGGFLSETGERFRGVGWTCFAVLALTGAFNLWVRGIGAAELGSAAWWGSPFGLAVALKLGAFALVVAVSAVHDFSVGPGAATAMREDPDGAETLALRRRASLLGRLNGVLALVLLALAVVLVRGWPG